MKKQRNSLMKGMEDKYIKFYKTFDKRFKNNENLILCSNTLSNGGVDLNSDLVFLWRYDVRRI